jgi:hypothetical protein
VKVKAAGVGTVVTLKVTFTVAGFTPLAELVSVIVPELTPAGTPAGLAATVTAGPPVVPLAVEAPLTVSQLWLLVAVNGTEEMGEVVTLRGCVDGVAEFTELNVSAEGEPTRLDVAVRCTVTQGVLEAEELVAAV